MILFFHQQCEPLASCLLLHSKVNCKLLCAGVITIMNIVIELLQSLYVKLSCSRCFCCFAWPFSSSTCFRLSFSLPHIDFPPTSQHTLFSFFIITPTHIVLPYHRFLPAVHDKPCTFFFSSLCFDTTLQKTPRLSAFMQLAPRIMIVSSWNILQNFCIIEYMHSTMLASFWWWCGNNWVYMCNHHNDDIYMYCTIKE